MANDTKTSSPDTAALLALAERLSEFNDNRPERSPFLTEVEYALRALAAPQETPQTETQRCIHTGLPIGVCQCSCPECHPTRETP